MCVNGGGKCCSYCSALQIEEIHVSNADRTHIHAKIERQLRIRENEKWEKKSKPIDEDREKGSETLSAKEWNKATIEYIAAKKLIDKTNHVHAFRLYMLYFWIHLLKLQCITDWNSLLFSIFIALNHHHQQQQHQLKITRTNRTKQKLNLCNACIGAVRCGAGVCVHPTRCDIQNEFSN